MRQVWASLLLGEGRRPDSFRLAGRLGQLDQPVEGVLRASLAGGRDIDGSLFHPLVPGHQKRPGLVVLPLPEQRLAEQQRLRIERRPGVGFFVLADCQALTQYRLGFDPLLLFEQGEAK